MAASSPNHQSENSCLGTYGHLPSWLDFFPVEENLKETLCTVLLEPKHWTCPQFFQHMSPRGRGSLGPTAACGLLPLLQLFFQMFSDGLLTEVSWLNVPDVCACGSCYTHTHTFTHTPTQLDPLFIQTCTCKPLLRVRRRYVCRRARRDNLNKAGTALSALPTRPLHTRCCLARHLKESSRMRFQRKRAGSCQDG